MQPLSHSLCQGQVNIPAEPLSPPEPPGPSQLPQKSLGGFITIWAPEQNQKQKVKSRVLPAPSSVSTCPRDTRSIGSARETLPEPSALTPVVSLEPDCLEGPASVSRVETRGTSSLLEALLRTAGKHPTRDCLFHKHSAQHSKQGLSRTQRIEKCTKVDGTGGAGPVK